MQIAKQVQKGFTLIELMIVVAIIGILASIAIPQYEAFIQRSEFKVMETAAAPFKVGVEMCAQEQSTDPAPLTGCSSPRAGRLGDIPAPIAAGTRGDDVSTVSVTDGVITVTSVAGAFGQAAATTYIMTPQMEGPNVVWYFQSSDATAPGYLAAAAEGTCFAARLCR